MISYHLHLFWCLPKIRNISVLFMFNKKEEQKSWGLKSEVIVLAQCLVILRGVARFFKEGSAHKQVIIHSVHWTIYNKLFILMPMLNL